MVARTGSIMFLELVTFEAVILPIVQWGFFGVMLHPPLASHYFNPSGPSFFDPFAPMRLRLEPEELAELRKMIKSSGSKPAGKKSRRKR